MIAYCWSILHKPNSTANQFSWNKNTAKLVLSGHSKKRQRKGLNDNGSLMKIESTAECCKVQYF